MPECFKIKSLSSPEQGRSVRGIIRAVVPVFPLLWLLISSGSIRAEPFGFEPGDRISYIGNALADRKQHDGWLETYLHAAHPHHELVFRNFGFSGDQVHHRPRAHTGFGDADSHLSRAETTVIFAFFGYNESFDDPDLFANRLIEWIDHTLRQNYSGDGPPRIVLFSPIAHENLGDPSLPDGTDNNRRLAALTHAMANIAQEKDVTFVDLFHGTQALYRESDQPLTINGVHLSSEGNRRVGRFITQALLGGRPPADSAELEELRQTVLDKNWHYFNRYRASSGNDVWGGRSNLHGNYETLQQELKMLDVMTDNRDQRIWTLAQGSDIEVDDANVPPPIQVETNYRTGEDIVVDRQALAQAIEFGTLQDAKDVRILSGEEAIGRMQLAHGLKANLFACEQRFPEIANPVQLQVDTKGRIWVAAWPTYPKWEPLKEMNDALVILQDTTGDGVADESTVFAYINNPTGFEFWNDGVIVVSAPNIWFLRDTTGDDKADEKILLMTGIDSADTHHSANNLVYGPDGYIYYQRGVFHLHNVETPWAKSHESTQPGLYRLNPRTHRFAFHVGNTPNSHGISFDRWGYHFITDATSGSAFQVVLEDANELRFNTRRLLQHTVRPVPGNQVLSSAHLGERFENNFLIYNVIGFLGIKRYELRYDDDGHVTGHELDDLLISSDPNFRPTHGVVGADGALYVSDWHNPIIGHMQHNLRDPMRDHTHGRIYRITAEDNPLQEPVSIHGEPVDKLLDLLRHPVDGVRHRVRIELSARDTAEVISAAQEWLTRYNPSAEEHAHPMLEILWLHQQHNVTNKKLLQALLESPVGHARHAARRVAAFWSGQPTPRTEHDLDDHLTQTAEEALNLKIDLTELEVAEITIAAVVERMLFDVVEFKVKAGQPVSLTLVNPDFMPHNLLIVKPGTIENVAARAIDLGAEGFARHFVPDTGDVLHATRMLKQGEKQTLEFNAPAEAGDYPYVCTFPGHAQLMRGLMKVVESSPLLPPAPIPHSQ